LQGEVEFRSILYVPAIAPTGKDDIVNPKTKNIRLYMKRVFISDDFDGELVNLMAIVWTREKFILESKNSLVLIVIFMLE
jgi:HSP90 family molecular chaperone